VHTRLPSAEITFQNDRAGTNNREMLLNLDMPEHFDHTTPPRGGAWAEGVGQQGPWLGTQVEGGPRARRKATVFCSRRQFVGSFMPGLL